jgi:hypothetical protein
VTHVTVAWRDTGRCEAADALAQMFIASIGA